MGHQERFRQTEQVVGLVMKALRKQDPNGKAEFGAIPGQVMEEVHSKCATMVNSGTLSVGQHELQGAEEGEFCQSAILRTTVSPDAVIRSRLSRDTMSGGNGRRAEAACGLFGAIWVRLPPNSQSTIEGEDATDTDGGPPLHTKVVIDPPEEVGAKGGQADVQLPG